MKDHKINIGEYRVRPRGWRRRNPAAAGTGRPMRSGLPRPV